MKTATPVWHPSAIADLRGQGLRSLPADVLTRTDLRVLCLYNNELRSLPDEVGALAQLEVLDVSGNKLRTWPACIFRLTNLRILRVDGNRLGSIPAAIARLTKLEQLHASSNRITSLPAEIGALRHLAVLHLWRNRIRHLPRTLAALQRLDTLNIEENALERLPPAITKLRRLRALRLSDNRLRAVPSGLGRLSKLRCLLLDNNKLPRVPQWILDVRRAIFLNLSGNPSARKISSLSTPSPSWTRILSLYGTPAHPRTYDELLWLGSRPYWYRIGVHVPNAWTFLVICTKENTVDWWWRTLRGQDGIAIVRADYPNDPRVLEIIRPLYRRAKATVFVGDLDPHSIVQYVETRRALLAPDRPPLVYGGVDDMWLSAMDQSVKPGRQVEGLRIPLSWRERTLVRHIDGALDLTQLIGLRSCSILRSGYKIELEAATNPAFYRPRHATWALGHLRSLLRRAAPTPSRRRERRQDT